MLRASIESSFPALRLYQGMFGHSAYGLGAIGYFFKGGQQKQHSPANSDSRCRSSGCSLSMPPGFDAGNMQHVDSECKTCRINTPRTVEQYDIAERARMSVARGE